jgi:hypothetical protein
MHTTIPSSASSKKAPWNKGHLIGQKRPLKPKDVRGIRVRLQLEDRKRDLALFNLAIDSPWRERQPHLRGELNQSCLACQLPKSGEPLPSHRS